MSFDQYQQTVLAIYNGGDHLVQTPSDVKGCGNTLLQFLLAELSESEDCDSNAEAVRRLESAISQLEAVKHAFEELAEGQA